MIHEVDDALRRLIREQALGDNQVEVSFDAPTKDWAARRNAPTINLYLYDIREDLKRKQRGLLNEYNSDGVVVARYEPPRHIKLSYLLTAWTQRPEDEHRLLSDLLYGFVKHESIPAELLTGSLSLLALPVPLSVALPPPEDRSFADVWTALGGELKPSLDVVASAPLDSARRFEAGPPATDGVQITVGDDEPVSHDVSAAEEPADADDPGTPGATPPHRVAMVRQRRGRKPQ